MSPAGGRVKDQDMYGYGYGEHMDSGGGWIAMGVWMLVLVLIVGVVVWAVMQWARRVPAATGTAPRTTARDVLDERLARGEIDIDEYQRRRAALDQPPPGA